ncbi:hypothetical protein R3P38DRAFT_2770273 [Favolaschia claudopus]|uniref:Uncharacterized protein n=1 Tax=Favolaschia claudopus TaxID=2862362 RepID=A0AAW0CDV7_9AGAR
MPPIHGHRFHAARCFARKIPPTEPTISLFKHASNASSIGHSPKTSSTTYDWSQGVPAVGHPRYIELITYAALDAEVPFGVIRASAPFAAAKVDFALALLARVLVYFRLHQRGIRSHASQHTSVPLQNWTFVNCPWFIGGDFNGYWM